MPLIAGKREVIESDTLDAIPPPQGHDRTPIDAERSGPEVLQIVDVEVATEVVVCEIRGKLQEVLLLADLVRLLLVRRLSVLLEVGVIAGLKPQPDVDEMGIKDRCPHPGADVPVGYQSALKERHVDDLADQRAGE